MPIIAIFNYGIVIFSLITDVKDKQKGENMQEMLTLAFDFIHGYKEDKNTQVKLYTVLYNIFKKTEWYRYIVFISFLDY